MSPESAEIGCSSGESSEDDTNHADMQLRRILFESQHAAHIGSWFWDIAADKIFWSEGVYRIFGIEPSVDPVNKQLHEKYIPIAGMQECNPRFDFEYSISSLEGRSLYIRSQGQTQYGPNGTPSYILGTIQDITENKEMELEIQSIRQSLEQTQSPAHAGSWERDYRTGHVHWSDETYRMYGIEKNSQDETMDLLVAEIKRMEKELIDNTEELTKKNKLIIDFIANMSHEFKTPLTIIMMQFELMKLYLDSPKDLEEMIDAAHQNSLRLLRLVNNILDLSRADAGYLKVSPESMDVVQFLKEICDFVDVYAQSKRIDLRFECALSSKAMQMDAEKLERILLNLLSNAIKYTPEEGRILVRVKFKKLGSVLLIVQDTGVGIPAEKLSTIFDRFAQVDNSLSRQNEGSGIGLALVKSLVDVLGGDISVYSNPGEGSTFAVELPMLEIQQYVMPYQILSSNVKNRVHVELSDIM